MYTAKPEVFIGPTGGSTKVTYNGVRECVIKIFIDAASF